eukprot:6409893-Amphidinium_carterae.1
MDVQSYYCFVLFGTASKRYQVESIHILRTPITCRSHAFVCDCRVLLGGPCRFLLGATFANIAVIKLHCYLSCVVYVEV